MHGHHSKCGDHGGRVRVLRLALAFPVALLAPVWAVPRQVVSAAVEALPARVFGGGHMMAALAVALPSLWGLSCGFGVPNAF